MVEKRSVEELARGASAPGREVKTNTNGNGGGRAPGPDDTIDIIDVTPASAAPAEEAPDSATEVPAADTQVSSPAKAKKKRKPRSKRERMKTSLSEILDVEGAAEALGVSRRLVLRLLRRGELRGRKVGREWRVAKQELLRWLREPDSAGGQEPKWLRGAIDSGRATLGGKEEEKRK